MRVFRSRRVGRAGTMALAAAAALATLCVSGAPAWANRPVQAQVSGQVTAVEGTAAVTVGSTTYLIAANSPAYQTIQSVRVGETIGLVLSGPAGDSSSQVEYIIVSGSGSSGTGSP
jgi:hypothetical protein